MADLEEAQDDVAATGATPAMEEESDSETNSDDDYQLFGSPVYRELTPVKILPLSWLSRTRYSGTDCSPTRASQPHPSRPESASTQHCGREAVV